MSAFVFAGSVFSQDLGREQKISEKPREEGSVAACNISPLTMIDVAYKIHMAVANPRSRDCFARVRGSKTILLCKIPEEQYDK